MTARYVTPTPQYLSRGRTSSFIPLHRSIDSSNSKAKAYRRDVANRHTCYAPTVSHRLGVFLRNRAAGLLHPASDRGVHRVSGFWVAERRSVTFPAMLLPYEEFPSLAALPCRHGLCLLVVTTIKHQHSDLSEPHSPASRLAHRIQESFHDTHLIRRTNRGLPCRFKGMIPNNVFRLCNPNRYPLRGGVSIQGLCPLAPSSIGAVVPLRSAVQPVSRALPLNERVRT